MQWSDAMKTFKTLTLGTLLLMAAAAGASTGDERIEVMVVTAKYPGPAPIEEIVVTAKYPAPPTLEKLRPVVLAELPRLNLEIPAMPRG
jgi:hypothetical protein